MTDPACLRKTLRRKMPVFLLVLALGVVGFAIAGLLVERAPQSRVASGLVGTIYQVGQLFLLNLNADQIHGSSLLRLAALCAILLLIVGTAAVLLRVWDEARLAGLALVRIAYRQRHVVICGLGRIGSQLARRCGQRTDGWKPLVIIESNPDDPDIQACRDRGAVVLVGNAADPDMLSLAQVDKASVVFAVTGDDAVNLEIAARLVRADGQADRAHRVLVRAHMTDTAQAEMANTELFSGHNHSGRVRVFSIHQMTARQLVRDQLTRCAPDPDGVAHYVILGFGPMGQAMALQAVRQAHFANRRKLRVTVLDDTSGRQRASFLARYPAFSPGNVDLTAPVGPADAWLQNGGPVTDACNAEFLNLPPDTASPELGDLLTARLGRQDVTGAVIVCLEEGDQSNLQASLHVHRHLRDRDCSHIPVYAWLPRLETLASLLARSDAIGIRPFGRPDQVCVLEDIEGQQLDSLAMRIHETYLRQREQETPCSDPGLKPWAELPPGMLESNRQQADHIDVKLAAVGYRRVASSGMAADSIVFTNDEIELLAEMEHNRWMAERLLDGWRYGPRKDKARKISADLVPYAVLPEATKDYDRNTVRKIPKILGSGECVEREQPNRVLAVAAS